MLWFGKGSSEMKKQNLPFIEMGIDYYTVHSSPIKICAHIEGTWTPDDVSKGIVVKGRIFAIEPNETTVRIYVEPE